MSAMDFTVLGCNGTVGRALTAALHNQGHRVEAVDRASLSDLLASNRPLGHVISCIGLTGDFRVRPLDTAEAHVGITANCLRSLHCESFLYLSSTRVYARGTATHEDAPLSCVPTDPSDLYNLTKLAGEALCLVDPRHTVRVVRLSNVYGGELGAATFLGQVIAAGRKNRKVIFAQAPDSEKDYVSLADVVRLLPAIAAGGRHRLYNAACGHNTSHKEIAATLSANLGWQTGFLPDAPTVRFPEIEIARLKNEFPPPLRIFSSDLARLASGQEAPCSRLTRQVVA